MTPEKDVSNGLNDVREDLQALRADVARLTNAMAALVEKRAAKVKSRLVDAEEELEARAVESKDWIEENIREKPSQALAVAVGAGFLIGLLLHRR